MHENNRSSIVPCNPKLEGKRNAKALQPDRGYTEVQPCWGKPPSSDGEHPAAQAMNAPHMGHEPEETRPMKRRPHSLYSVQNQALQSGVRDQQSGYPRSKLVMDDGVAGSLES